ncbi:malonyl CoA-acyl carrier protein transacylase [Crossiella equi]|uniref:Malonyl CoA-acyl carrier protein transacylase n=1 Tax=Crossiella equi TaxID=130796 RepID=A0ABS5AS92_9PSEU|nr:acyltransferase domain-containing protein [Crossiella equi]MBP2479453.1 malonyl CoA-acyl carrier protein transacylase [Crossiella equi]
MTTALLFPGQGVQRPEASLELFRRWPDEVDQASTALGFDLVRLCHEADEAELARTRHTQPLTYLTSALAFRESGLVPEVVLGHSLGEFNALEAAGVFDLATGLELVRQRAVLTSDCPPGVMTAVQGLSAEVIGTALAEEGLYAVEIVNFNTPVQVVLAGPPEPMAAAEALVRRLNAVDVRRLRITGAFHSSHMHGPARRFAEVLAGVGLAAPRVPVVANRTARPHEPGRIGAVLAQHLTHPVRWHESVTWVTEHYPDVRFTQPGHSQVLVRMLAQIPATRHHARLAAGGSR